MSALQTTTKDNKVERGNNNRGQDKIHHERPERRSF